MLGKRRWLVSSGIAHGELILTSDLTREEQGLARDGVNRLPERAAWQTLDVATRWSIARVLGVHETHLHEAEAVRAAFDRAVTQGRIVGLRFEDARGKPLRHRLHRLPRRYDDTPPAPRPPQPPLGLGEDARPLDWIEIELVDEEGSPVIGQTIRLRPEGASERQGSTDARGRVREELPTGDVVVTFPDLDRADWKPLSGPPR